MHEITNCFHIELDPPPSIFDVFKGTTNLYYSPVFGGYSLPLKNAKVRRIQLKPSPLTYEEGKTVAIYLLYYGDLLKIGTSSINRVVNRMYVQAPFAGVIASIIRLDKSVKEPVIEQKIIKTLISKHVIKNRPQNQRYIIMNNVNLKVTRKVSSATIIKKWLEKYKIINDNLEKKLEFLLELGEHVWNASKEIGTPLYEPNIGWFITKESPIRNYLIRSKPINRLKQNILEVDLVDTDRIPFIYLKVFDKILVGVYKDFEYRYCLQEGEYHYAR